MNKVKYIPGDLVIYKGNVCEIMSADNGDKRHSQYSIIQVGKGIESFTFAHERDIEPIPISAQILEKNGWEKERIYYTNKFIPRIKLCTCEEGYEDKWSVSINGDIIGGYIYHVHQLQHILFGLGLDSNIKL